MNHKTWAWLFLLLIVGLVVFPPFHLGANPFFGDNPHPEGTEEPAKDSEKIPKKSLSPGYIPRPSGQYFIQQQGFLRERLGNLFASFTENPSPLQLVGILSIAFLYGILHSLGPGHRKGVLLSIYLARKAPVWEPAAMGLLLSLIHGGFSILFLFLLLGVSGALGGITSLYSFYFEAGTMILLILLALWLLLHTLHDLISGEHTHSSGKAGIGTVIVSGIYPCPGTILILVLAVSLNMVWLGILAILAMSLGVSIPIIGFAYLGWLSRESIFLTFKKRKISPEKLSAWIQLGGYTFLLGFTLYVAFPYFQVIIRP